MNDASGRRMIANIELVSRVVVPAIVNMGSSQEGDGNLSGAEAAYVEHLCSFNE